MGRGGRFLRQGHHDEGVVDKSSPHHGLHCPVDAKRLLHGQGTLSGEQEPHPASCRSGNALEILENVRTAIIQMVGGTHPVSPSPFLRFEEGIFLETGFWVTGLSYPGSWGIRWRRHERPRRFGLGLQIAKVACDRPGGARQDGGERCLRSGGLPKRQQSSLCETPNRRR